MPKHPCAEGLSSACFKAYPKWARQVLAYKLLHILVPKQISKNLPTAFGNGIFLPPDDWDQWLNWLITQGFEPGDALPPGWEHGIPPPNVFPPGYSDGIVKPETGPEAPIFIPPFEPGPIGGSYSSAPLPFDIGELLVEQGSNLRALNVGDSMTFFDLGMAIETAMHAQIHAIDIKVGRYNIPLDSVGLEIWTADSSYKPVLIVGSGSSNTKKGSSLLEYSTDLDYARFLFTGTPELSVTNKYAIVIGRTGDVWTDRYYQVGEYQFGSRNYHYQLENGTWYIRGTSRLNCRIWGIAL